MRNYKLYFTVPLFILLCVATVIGWRWWRAGQEVADEWAARSIDAPPLATTSMLEVIPLYDAVGTRSDVVIGHGVSYLIRTDSAAILLDVGNNPAELSVAPFATNMQALGIDWAEIYRVVISHPHPDHIGGVTAWRERTISFGGLPGGVGERLVFVPHGTTWRGAIHATIPTLPAPDIATTGVISYREVWPLTLFAPKGGEQALVVHVDGHGLVLITGCGHPGLERLVMRAEELYGHQVIGVVGGLHFTNAGADKLQSQVQLLQSRAVSLVALSPHDSGPEALSIFESEFADAYHRIAVGESIQFP